MATGQSGTQTLTNTLLSPPSSLLMSFSTHCSQSGFFHFLPSLTAPQHRSSLSSSTSYLLLSSQCSPLISCLLALSRTLSFLCLLNFTGSFCCTCHYYFSLRNSLSHTHSRLFQCSVFFLSVTACHSGRLFGFLHVLICILSSSAVSWWAIIP